MRSVAHGGFAVSAKGHLARRDITSDIGLMKQKAANAAPAPLKPAKQSTAPQPQAPVSMAKFKQAVSNTQHAANVVSVEMYRHKRKETPMHDAERWRRSAIGGQKEVVAMRSAMIQAAQASKPADRVLKPRMAPTLAPAAPALRMKVA
ncbi:MAG: hypothetical protein AAF569_06650 [Pseudomonadota bacterium]